MFYSISTIAPVCRKLHADCRQLALVTGFFDLLHLEHRNFLSKAKSVGDVLVVGVESDARARKLKGEGRPYEPQDVRCQHILDHFNTNEYRDTGLLGHRETEILVIKLPDDFDHYEAFDALMSSVRPNIFAVSSHTLHQDKKAALAEKYGGSLLVVHDYNPEISTTKLNHQNQV